jgi:hypothetical protein
VIEARADETAGIDRGLLLEVVEDEGTGLVGDHAAGATVLAVAASAFRAAGTCRVAGVEYAYTRSENADLLSIDPPLAADAEDGDPVESLTPDGRVEQTLVALVDLDLDGESPGVEAVVRGEDVGFYPAGLAAAGAIVQVRDVPYGYETAGRPSDVPSLDSAVITTPYLRGHRVTDVSVASGVLTAVTGWAVSKSTSMDPPSAGWFPITESGIYLVVFSPSWQANNSGSRYSIIETRDTAGAVASARQVGITSSAGITLGVQVAAALLLPAGWAVRMVVQQTSSGTLNLVGSSDGRLTGVEIVKVATA